MQTPSSAFANSLDSIFYFEDNDQASIVASTTTSNPLLSFLDVRDVMNSTSVTGDRSAARFELALEAPSGNSPIEFNPKYQVLVGENRESVNDGGIPEPGDYSRWSGVLGNTIASTISMSGLSAAAFAMVAGLEVDSTESSSDGSYRKVGMRDSINAGDEERGTEEDAALTFSKNATGSSWKDLIEVGSLHGFPAAADSTLLVIGTESGSMTFPAGWGVDLRGVTFNSAFLGSQGFRVDGSGDMAANALVAGEVTSITVLAGGDYAPGYTGALCPNASTSILPTISVAAETPGLSALLQVGQWSPDITSITVQNGGSGNSSSDPITIPGTGTKFKPTVNSGGTVTGINTVTTIGSTLLFPSSSSSPWPSTSPNKSAIPPTFCIGEFKINSVSVLRPGWGFVGTETVAISPSMPSVSLVASFSPNVVDVATSLNIDPPSAAAYAIQIGGTKVLGARRHGWSGVTGSIARGAFSTTSGQTLVAETLGALIDDLTTHGLIGP